MFFFDHCRIGVYDKNCLGCPDPAAPADPFFTDLSGLTLQSSVGVGPGGRMVKDEYSVGGGTAGPGVPVGSGMDVDGEMNQTIQHHPPTQPPTQPSNSQQNFVPGLPPPATGKLFRSVF